MMQDLSVIISTHNPHSERLRRTLAGLKAQTIPVETWELVVVDNGSAPSLSIAEYMADAPVNTRWVQETRLGLSFARRRGLQETRGDFALLVDDDNVLNRNYLEIVRQEFAANPTVGALGGRSIGEFGTTPEPWHNEFFNLLAIRDLGPARQVSSRKRGPVTNGLSYPSCAPIGAGMAIRRAAIQPWLSTNHARTPTDRKGRDLTSGGDNDIVLSIVEGGWGVEYVPDLSLTHLIPTERLDPGYLARLNRGIQKSWVQVLDQHGIRPWRAISPWSVPLRKTKAWLTYRAWSGPAAHIRWQGACGRFEGLASISANG